MLNARTIWVALLGSLFMAGAALLAEPPRDSNKDDSKTGRKSDGSPLAGPNRRARDADQDKRGPGDRKPPSASRPATEDPDEVTFPPEDEERPGRRPPRQRPGRPMRPEADMERGGPDRPPPDGPPEPRGMRHGDRPWRRLSAEQMDEAMQLLREHFPQVAERLAAIRERDPEQFERVLGSRMPLLMRIMHSEPRMRELIIEDYKQQMEIDRLLPLLAGATNEEERMELRRQLRTAVEAQFQVRIEKHRRVIADLERRLREQKRVLDERVENADRLIDERVEDLLGRRPGMQFPPE